MHTGRAYSSAASQVGSRSASCISFSSSPSRPRSGRLRPEEAVCFRRLPTPSSSYGAKAEIYCGGTLPLKTHWVDRGYHTLPAMKGEFYRFSADQFHEPDSPSNDLAKSESLKEAAEELPLEREERATARVLEQIYPVNRGEELVERTPKRVTISKQPRFGALTASALVQANNNKQPGQEKRDGRFAAQRAMRQFRTQLLDRFATMGGAFESFASTMSGGIDRELTRKDFSRFLNKNFKGLSRDDHSQVFDFLDTDKSGTVSVAEFHQAIEATAPVRTIEDLRRKLIALGYASMRQAVREIEYDRGKKVLNLQEFGQALTRLGITQEDEHSSIFQVLCDPHGAHKQQVTVEQLAAALAAVSPSLLLEDVRDRLIKRYGNLTAAFAGLDLNCSLTISSSEFIRNAQGPWRLEPHEATKAFAVVDADHSKTLTRREFISALSLVEPSLYHEDIRRKIRQRFRSIAEALLKDEFGLPAGARPGSSPVGSRRAGGKAPPRENKAGMQQQRSIPGNVVARSVSGLSESNAAALLQVFMQGGDMDSALQKKTPAAFQELLQRVQLTDGETNTLFQLVDVDKDGILDPVEFVRGIRIFAPSTMLDDLRLRCLSLHAHVADAFASLPPAKHSEVLSIDGLREVLESLGLAEGVDVQGVVELVEPQRGEGGLTISELVSALQAATPGGQTPLAPEVRDARARQQVRATMAPFFSSARELRADVRQQQQQLLNSRGNDRSFSLPLLQTSMLNTVREDLRTSPCNSGRAERTAESMWSHVPGAPPPLRLSYLEVSKYVGMLPATDSQPIIERIHGYYKSAGNRVVHDSELLQTAESRFQQYRNLCKHTSAIERPATTKVADSPKAEQPP